MENMTGGHDETSEPDAHAAERLAWSRPARFDPHIARAVDVTRAGKIGSPRTLALTWSWPDDGDLLPAAVETIDLACYLLDGEPAALFALACQVAGPPLLKINLRLTNCAIAAIEVSGERDDLPPRRELHLIGTDGEIVHRIGNDDLLWSDSRATALPNPATSDELRARERAARTAGTDDHRLATDRALARDRAVAAALARSLADRETVTIEIGGAA